MIQLLTLNNNKYDIVILRDGVEQYVRGVTTLCFEAKTMLFYRKTQDVEPELMAQSDIAWQVGARALIGWRGDGYFTAKWIIDVEAKNEVKDVQT